MVWDNTTTHIFASVTLWYIMCLSLLCLHRAMLSEVGFIVQVVPAGPRRLYFKRSIYIPKSPTEMEELASTVFETGPHYLSFIDAMYHYLHGFYRFEPTTAAVYGGNLLAAFRGSYKAERDTPELIRCVVSHLLYV
jgi:hypothetical protein